MLNIDDELFCLRKKISSMRLMMLLLLVCPPETETHTHSPNGKCQCVMLVILYYFRFLFRLFLCLCLCNYHNKWSPSQIMQLCPPDWPQIPWKLAKRKLLALQIIALISCQSLLYFRRVLRKTFRISPQRGREYS